MRRSLDITSSGGHRALLLPDGRYGCAKREFAHFVKEALAAQAGRDQDGPRGVHLRGPDRGHAAKA